MISFVFGILLSIVGGWFSLPMTVYFLFSHHTIGNAVSSFLSGATLLGTGILLISGIGWWWIFLVGGIAVVAIWSMVYVMILKETSGL